MAPNTSGGDRAGSDVPAAATLTYADASAELDAIIEEFEAGVVDVDRLVARLERAAAIVDELDRRLRRTRMQVEELVPRLEAIGRGDIADSSGDADVVGDRVPEAPSRGAVAEERSTGDNAPDDGIGPAGSGEESAPQGLF